MVNLVYADLRPDSASNLIDLRSISKTIGLTRASLILKKVFPRRERKRHYCLSAQRNSPWLLWFDWAGPATPRNKLILISLWSRLTLTYHLVKIHLPLF
jgi:hypothetical protein